MSRLSLIWLIAFLLQTYCNRYSQAQNISQIKAAIERKRVEEGQIEQIRNKILKELVHDGAKIRTETLNRVEHPRNEIPVNREEIKTDFKNEIKTGSDQSTKSKFIVTIGVPASQVRDKCLAFHLAKYIKDKDHIIPKKINLWIHLRKRGSKNSKRKKSDKNARLGAFEHRRKKDNLSIDKKKGRKKNRRRRQGRRIKIFISDGKKTLVKMRMRVSKTKWYKIELPISQFPDVISVNDSFKLCFKCKRCGKKIKMDLYRRERELNSPGQVSEITDKPDKPTIPFMHIEEPRSQTIYRYKRSSDDINNKHRHGHFGLSRSSHGRSKCCSEEIYKEEITKVFPSILYPESINISLCSANTDSTLDQPLLSQSNLSYRQLSGMQCVPNKYETFNFVYVNTHLKLRHASIPDLIPVGCSCRHVT